MKSDEIAKYVTSVVYFAETEFTVNMPDTFNSTDIVNIGQLCCMLCHKENPVFGHQMRRQAHPKQQQQPAIANTIQNKNMYALVCYAYQNQKTRIRNLADRKAFD